MKTLRLLSVVALLGFTACDGMFPFGNDIAKKDIYGTWKPIQFEENGVVTEPTIEERNDYVQFNSDESFVCVEKTKEVEGTWYYTRLNTTINVMVDENNPNDCIPWKVESVSDSELIYTKTSNSGRKTKVWLVK